MSLVLTDVVIQKNHTIIVAIQSLRVESGEILTIMGPSGSGKSTLLAWLAGVLPTSLKSQGHVYLNHHNMTQVAAEKRQVGLLFQEDRLFPHLSVLENLQFALPQSMRGRQRVQRSLDALSQVALAQKASCYPDELSGGQKARVSLLRTLLAQPKAILLDEPFSQLDKTIRASTRQWVFSQIKTQQLPCILVTHDAEDIASQQSLFYLKES